MGRGAEFYCKTCRKRHYLGYGSYSTWLDHCQSVQEYDEAVTNNDLGEIPKNQHVRACLVEHAGHDHFTASADWTYEQDGTLYYNGGGINDKPLVTDLPTWEYIDMDPSK